MRGGSSGVDVYSGDEDFEIVRLKSTGGNSKDSVERCWRVGIGVGPIPVQTCQLFAPSPHSDLSAPT